MVLRHHIQRQGLTTRLTLPLNAPNAIPQTQNSLANLAAHHANHYTNAMIAKSRSIILNAIDAQNAWYSRYNG